MKKFHLYLIVFVLFACQKEEDTVRKKVGLESFHTVELNEAFEVKLIEGHPLTIGAYPKVGSDYRTGFFFELEGKSEVAVCGLVKIIIPFTVYDEVSE